jgi:hypothetical protein
MTIHWDTRPEQIHQPLIIEVFGPTFTGRTYLALKDTLRPAAFFHCTERLRGTIDEFLTGDGNLRVHDFGRWLASGKERDDIAEAATEALEDFEDHWYDALRWSKLMIVDTHTDLWELHRYAGFGGVSPEKYKGMERLDTLWGEVNAKWNMLFTTALGAGCDIVLVGKTKEQYRANKATGKLVPSGQKHLPNRVDVSLQTDMITTEAGEKAFTATVVKPGIDYRLVGTTFTNLTLDTIIATLYGSMRPLRVDQ